MDNFASRVRARRKEIGISQVDLAKAAGVSQTTISDIERGRNEGSAEIVAIATALQCNAEWLSTGKGPKKPGGLAQMFWDTRNVNVSSGPDIKGKEIPLISWVQAGVFCTSPDLLQPGDAEDWIPAAKKHGPHTYALRVVGDSMVFPYPSAESFFPGTIIFVDPDKAVTNGCKVIAKISGTEEATFKVYKEDAGKRFLNPQNPQYPSIEMDDTMHICGVVVWKSSEVI